MNIPSIAICLTAIALAFPAFAISNEWVSKCSEYPYAEGLLIKSINGNTTYIYTVAEQQNIPVKDSYSLIKLRASRIASKKLAKYIYTKYKHQHDFAGMKVGGVFFVSECLSQSEKKYYASYAWSKESHRLSENLKKGH